MPERLCFKRLARSIRCPSWCLPQRSLLARAQHLLEPTSSGVLQRQAHVRTFFLVVLGQFRSLPATACPSIMRCCLCQQEQKDHKGRTQLRQGQHVCRLQYSGNEMLQNHRTAKQTRSAIIFQRCNYAAPGVSESCQSASFGAGKNLTYVSHLT